MIKGKIFPESSSVEQDQAKLLFDYYLQSAEKIVQEEERIEKEIAKLEEEKTALNQQLEKAKLWKWVLLITIIGFFVMMFKEKGLVKQIADIESRIDEFKKLHNEIFRDYKVSKLGIAYVPVASQIKYEDKSFIVDHTGMVEESEVKLQLSKQNDLLIEKISELEKLSTEAPMVETSNEIEEIDTEQYSRSMQQINQHDYFGNLDRTLRTISYCMDDLDVTSVSLPLVANESKYLNFIKEFATSEVPKDTPVFEVFDQNKYKDDINKFQELNKLKDSLARDTAQFEDVLKGLMITMANSVQAISAMKIASTDKIIFESNKLLFKILKSPYNHYSPVLEASEIERIKNENFNYGEAVQDYIPFQLKDSSRLKYNLLSDSWVAEDGSSTNFPFGIHQIHEEIVAPMVQNLMNENRIERMKIYNHIKDQKINYLNKWHQDTEDFYGRNRAESADLINLMRSSLRDYVAAYNTMESLRKTEDSMKSSGGSLDATVVSATDNSADTLAAFELQSKEFHNVQIDFEAYMDRLKEDIEMKAEKFEHIDYYDALLRDGNARDNAVAASEVNIIDERRKPLIAVNPLFAKSSEMPPVPNIEPLTFEHISLNLPAIAINALEELSGKLIDKVTPNIQNKNNKKAGKEGKEEAKSPAAANVEQKNEASEPTVTGTDTVSKNEIDKDELHYLEDREVEETNKVEASEEQVENEEAENVEEEEENEEEVESKEEDDEDLYEYEISIVALGKRKNDLINTICELTGFDNDEAIEFLDRDEDRILIATTQEEAFSIMSEFKKAGAEVKVVRKLKDM
ncbi:MAG: hypothetical protein M0P71_13480 [Melioribacteraceae bacterium]|nr:hypothetical protein [Melioribacteraceae bacterium]